MQGHGRDRLPRAEHGRRPHHQLFFAVNTVTIIPNSISTATTTTATTAGFRTSSRTTSSTSSSTDSRCRRRLLLLLLLLLLMSSGRVTLLHELGQLQAVHLARRRQRCVPADAALSNKYRGEGGGGGLRPILRKVRLHRFSPGVMSADER